MRLGKSKKNTSNKASSSLTSRSSVGIDVNQDSIKMVLVSGRNLNQVQVEKYAITKLPKDVINGTRIQDFDQFVSYLQHTYKQINSGKMYIAAMPQSLTTVETLNYNKNETDMSEDDFAEFEISQFAPIDEVNYDYIKFDETTKAKKAVNKQILIAAGRKEDIDARIEAFETAGLKLGLMDVDILAEINAFSFWLNQRNTEGINKKIALVVIAEDCTHVLVVQNGKLLYKQEAQLSGAQLLQLIQRSYQVIESQALEMLTSSDKPSDYQDLVADRFNSQVAQEIQRVLQFYYATQSGDQLATVEYIYLTGSAAQQPGLAEMVYSQTNTPTEWVHPINAAEISKKIDANDLQAKATALTTAFGLALRGI